LRKYADIGQIYTNVTDLQGLLISYCLKKFFASFLWPHWIAGASEPAVRLILHSVRTFPSACPKKA